MNQPADIPQLLSLALQHHQSGRLALAEGADFLKTSTGRTPVGATPEAARVLLEAIVASGRRAGFKASGGVRTLADAAVYIGLAREILGPWALTPQRFRIGLRLG